MNSPVDRPPAQRFLVLGLIAGLCLDIGLAAQIYVEHQHSVAADLAGDTEQAAIQDAIAALRPDIDGLRHDIDALHQHQLPHLIPLKLGAPIELAQGFASLIEFTQDPASGRLAYRLVAQNTLKIAVTSQLDILFFNAQGLQIGISHTGIHDQEASHADTRPGVLERGEIKTFADPIELSDPKAGYADCRYFQLRFYTPDAG